MHTYFFCLEDGGKPPPGFGVSRQAEAQQRYVLQNQNLLMLRLQAGDKSRTCFDTGSRTAKPLYPVHCHGTYIYVAKSTIPVAKDE